MNGEDRDGLIVADRQGYRFTRATRLFNPYDVVFSDEITFDYHTTEYELFSPFQCQCGSIHCVKDIRGYKHLAAAHRQRLAPLAAPHIQAMSEGAWDLTQRFSPRHQVIYLRDACRWQVFVLFDRLNGYRTEKRRFAKVTGNTLNLHHPESFGDKLVWKKIHDRNPLLPIAADKYKVRRYVRDVLGPDGLFHD